MIGIVNAALALTSCEAQGIVVPGGQEKPEAGAVPGTVGESFKKKLENCVAAIIPVQPTVTDGSEANAEAGIQAEPGVQGISGAGCVFEGFEMPGLPPDVAEAHTQAADMPGSTVPVDGMARESLPDGNQADSTPEPNAWMQKNTTAGEAGNTPVQTQDQILRTVGAYIDAPSETAPETTGAQTASPMEVQAAASPSEEPAEVQSPAAATVVPKTAAKDGASTPGEATGEPGISRTEMDAAQKPAAPAAPAGASTGEQVVEKAEGDAGLNVKHDTAAPADNDEAGETRAAHTPIAGFRETAPAAKDTAVTARTEVKPEETAAYTKENVLRIVDKVSTHASEGRYDFDVELKPDFLGKVSIKVTMEDGSIRMQIKTDDISVKGMLSDQTSSLANALKEKGITLTSVDVTYESQASLDSGRQPFEQNSGGRQGSMYYAQSESAGYEPAAEPYSYFVGNSSVEFLA